MEKKSDKLKRLWPEYFNESEMSSLKLTEQEVAKVVGLYFNSTIVIKDSVGVYHNYKLVGIKPKYDEGKKQNTYQLLCEPICTDDPLNEPSVSFWNWIDECKLLLTPLSKITDEHAMILHRMAWPDYPEKDFSESAIEMVKINLNNDIISYKEADQLREWGYAVPYKGSDLFELGLAIES